jgi:hypothetical protein
LFRAGVPNLGDASLSGLSPQWSKTLSVLIWFTLGGRSLYILRFRGGGGGGNEGKRLGTPGLEGLSIDFQIKLAETFTDYNIIYK